MRDQNLTCIGCPLGCSISVSLSDNGEVSEITGNTCKKRRRICKEGGYKSVESRYINRKNQQWRCEYGFCKNSRRYSKRKNL